MTLTALKTVPIGECTLPIQTWNPTSYSEQVSFRYIDISSVSQEKKTINLNGEVAISEAPSRARQLVHAGDVLVSTVRPNLNAVAFVPNEMDGAIASTGFCVLRPNKELISGRYLFHWVQSPSFITNMVKQSTGQSYPAVSDKIVKQSEIPLPPLDEQKRIAAILDQADALRRLRQRAIDRLNQLGQAIFYEMFGDPAKQDEARRYPIRILSTLCTKITDGTHQSPGWSHEGVPFIFVSNVRNLSISFETNKFVSKETYNQLTRLSPIECGDVLYTAVGSYGNAAVVDTSGPFLFQRHIAHLKPNQDKLDSVFLSYCLESKELRRQADRAAKGVAQKTVTLADIKGFEIPYPPKDLQDTFHKRISSLRGLCSSASDHYTNLASMFSSLQHRAFRGEL